MAIFGTLILRIHEHGKPFHVLIFTSISFFGLLKFSSYVSSTCLVRFILKYYILLEAIVKGLISLIFFSVCLPFIYRRPSGVCELILHLASLLKVFISCRGFLVECLASYHLQIEILCFLSFLVMLGTEIKCVCVCGYGGKLEGEDLRDLLEMEAEKRGCTRRFVTEQGH